MIGLFMSAAVISCTLQGYSTKGYESNGDIRLTPYPGSQAIVWNFSLDETTQTATKEVPSTGASRTYPARFGPTEVTIDEGFDDVTVINRENLGIVSGPDLIPSGVKTIPVHVGLCHLSQNKRQF